MKQTSDAQIFAPPLIFAANSYIEVYTKVGDKDVALYVELVHGAEQMTKINRLTQLTTLEDSDLSVVWQDSSERTRAITIENLRKFIQSTDPNADAFVKAELVGDELTLTSHDETETKIDINILPEHSVTELKDMPDSLVSGNYLRVNDDGDGFILTPASEASAAIIVQDQGSLLGLANVIDFNKDFDLSIVNGKLSIKLNPRNSTYTYQDVAFGDQPVINNDSDCGIDYIFSATTFSQDMLVNGSAYSTGARFRVTNKGANPSKPIEVQIESSHGAPTYYVQTVQEFEFFDGAWRPVMPDEFTAVIGSATAATRGIKSGQGVNLQQDLDGLTSISSSAKNLLYLDSGDDSYQIIDRQYPVNSDSPIDDYQLVAISEGVNDVPKVDQISSGQLASGVSVNQDGQLFSIASGTYGFDIFTFAESASVYDKIYIDDSGKLTLTETDFIAGWVINGGVIIDVDLYNATVTAKNNNADRPTFKSVGIDTNESGEPNSTALIHQDEEYRTVIDATKELQVNHKDTGTGTITAVAVIDNNQAKFLAPLYEGDDKVALVKDVPVIPDNGYIEKYDRADTNYVQIAYEGKYGDGRNYYPVQIKQDGNGWTQLNFTGNMVFHCIDKDNGNELSSPLEIKQSQIVHNVQPYYGDKKLATKATHHISNTANFTEVITQGGQQLNTWMSENPDYTPAELLDVMFKSKVLGSEYWVVSVSASGNTYNGTIPSGYSQWEIHRNGSASRNFMRVYHKESHSVYFAPYKAGEDPVWKRYAYKDDIDTTIETKIAEDKAKGIWIGGVAKDTLSNNSHSGDQFDCSNPKHYIEFKKTNVGDSEFKIKQRAPAESSEITVHLHSESGLTSQKFRFYTSDNLYQERTIRLGEKWRFYLRKGVYPYYERIDDGSSSSASYSGQGLGVPKGVNVGTSKVEQPKPTALYYNSLDDGSSRGNIELKKTEGYSEFNVIINGLNKKTRSWRVSAGVTGKYSDKTIRPGETWQCRAYVDWSEYSNTNFYWTRLDEGTTYFTAEEAADMINNQATIDLICKSRYGSDCVYINTLTAEV